MGTLFTRLISRLLVVCMIGLPFQVNAGLIGTDAVLSAAQAQAARDAVGNFVTRAEVTSQLQSLGLAPQDASGRVAALTDSEVATIAGHIDNLPAGAVSGWAVVLIVAVIWLAFFRK